jgi:hypothetical protein
MAKDRPQITLDGQELAIEDFNAVGKAAANADDVALQEFLRLKPYGGSVAKAILPFGPATGQAGDTTAFIAPGNAGTLKVMPFRFVVGSRDTVANLGAGDNWQDQRSGVFAQTTDGTTLGFQIPTGSFPSNSSGNPRIDLVYATYTVDVAAATATRIVKPVPSGAATPTTVTINMTQPVGVGVVTGTPGATPAAPALPADVGTTFYAPLAYVVVSNGFVSGTTAHTVDKIQIVSTGRPEGCARPMGIASASPMQCVSSVLTATLTGPTMSTLARWASVGKAGVPWIMPANQQGMIVKRFAAYANHFTPIVSLDDTNVVDQSIDWRNRDFLVFASAIITSAQFPFQHGAATSGANIPGASVIPTLTAGQSYVEDDTARMGITRSGGTVFYDGSTGGTKTGLYVDLTTGQLKMYNTWATDNFDGRWFWWIFASGAFDNIG